MASSPDGGLCGDDTAKPSARLHRWHWLAALLLAALALLAFVGYSQPELLLDAVNLRYCG